MRGGGRALALKWEYLSNWTSPRAWVAQLTWIDPISLARKDYLPFLGKVSPGFWSLAPVAWLAAAMLLGILATAARKPERERRGWWILGALLLIGGFVAPDTLGPNQGYYFQQRIVLLGLVALMPVLRLDVNTSAGRFCRYATAGAVLLQSAIVWDYARMSERTAGTMLRARRAIEPGSQVATLLNNFRTPFRANPLLHADCALGVGTGAIIWANYEARLHYFPVQFRPGLEHPDPAELETISLADEPEEAAERLRQWANLITRYAPVIDTLVVWGRDPALDAFNAQRFVEVYADGPVRVLRRRKATSPPSSTGRSANPDRRS